MRIELFVVLVTLCAFALVARAQQSFSFVTSGGVNSPQSTPFGPSGFQLAQFQPGRFDRLERIEWSATGTVFGRGTVRNNSNFSLTTSINVSTTVSIQRVGGSFGNLSVNLFPGGSSSVFVAPRSSSSAFAAGTNTATGVLDASQFAPYIGTGSVPFQLSAATGSLFGVSSGGRIEAFGGLTLSYVYTPIGQVANDPIGRTSGTLAAPRFDNVPTSRWLLLTAATSTPAFELQASSSSRFASVPNTSVPVRVEADGVDFGLLNPSQSLSLPQPASRLVLRPTGALSSLVVPIDFSASTGSFSVRAIPSPSVLVVLAVGALASRRRRAAMCT